MASSAASSTLPSDTFEKMVQNAEANPGTPAYGSAGLGAASQLRLERPKAKAGRDMLDTP